LHWWRTTCQNCGPRRAGRTRHAARVPLDIHRAAAIWAQLIAWDLFIGRWMHLESRSLRIHPLVMAPVYALTILLSPFGFSTFLVVRSVAASGVMQETRGPRWLPASNEG
jgi:hypothetical protein